MRIAIIDHIHPCLQEMLEAAGHECLVVANETAEEIRPQLAKMDGIVVRSKMVIDQEIIDSCPELKFIGRVGSGLEAIDIDHANSRGIICFNSPEGNRNAVAEHAVGMILSLFNNLMRADEEVRRGVWKREENRGIELDGKTVGIIGYGNTGSTLAKVLSGFGVTIIAYDKYVGGFGSDVVEEVTLEALQQRANVVSFHVPLNDETTHLVNTAFIDAMAKPFYLINTSRGKVVSLDDLVAGMENNKVLGACLDVLEYESFLLDGIEPGPSFNYLKSSDKVVLSPHVAGLTHQSYEKLSYHLARKILDQFS